MAVPEDVLRPSELTVIGWLTHHVWLLSPHLLCSELLGMESPPSAWGLFSGGGGGCWGQAWGLSAST